MIELVAPGSNLASCMPQVSKPLWIQALVSQSSVETFHMRILNGLSWLNMDQFNPLLHSPGQEMTGGKFTAVVHADPLRLAAQGNHMVECSDDAPAGETSIHFQGQAFPCESVHHTEHPYRSAVRQAIVYEVDGPLLVGPNRGEGWLPYSHQSLPLLSLDAQTSRTVHAKHSFMVHNLPFSAQENGEAAIPEARFLVRQLCQLLSERVVFVSVRSIPKTRACDVCQLAGFALTRGELLHQERRICASVYELSPFFVRSAFSISRSRLRSATSRFNRLFSSSR
jgi:hypothetical protein